jgi:hypothetical protein
MNTNFFSSPHSTRRDFLSSAAALAAGLSLPRGVFAEAAAKPNSVMSGVRVGCISYSYRSMATSAEDVLKALITDGLSEVELMGNSIQQYAGIAGAPGGKGKGKNTPPVVEPAVKVTDAQREEQLAKCRELRKMYNDAGVNIHLHKLSFGQSDEEIEMNFLIAKALGAVGITTERNEFLARRVAPFAEKHKIWVAFHNHTNNVPVIDKTDPILEIGEFIGLNVDKPKTIVLQSAWDTVNIGDIGHTPGTLRVIEQHLPEVKIVLWAMKLDDRVTAMLKARFPKVEILQGNLFKDGENDRKLQEAVKACDFFIRNSGMGQDITFMQFCQKHGKPYGLFGQSYFPSMVEGKGAEERIALLNGASFIYTRETKTLKILQGAGIKAAALQFGPDGCFGIDVRDDERGSPR